MTQLTTSPSASALRTLAEGGQHDSLNAYAIGAGTLAALLLLLWITTRLNRDR
ncbi:hypothetical protein [Streptomyces marincola]|uniref:hypothetical protein n=1 Tax=Streptomyces marincola TaxID=2878388 RepID=UPI00159C782A|nr:hypothetical protein [Streptomyces marincola]